MGQNTGFKLRMIEGPNPGQEFILSKQRHILGREPGPDVDIIISSPTVSRRHARITQRNQQWFLEDLGSSNGTFLNGNLITVESAALKNGDNIQLGSSIKLVVQSTEPVGYQAVDRPVGATVLQEDIDIPIQAAPPQLFVTLAGSVQRTYKLTKGTITLGRSPDNDIVIDSQIVSRHHARLERSVDGYRLVVLPEASNPVLYKGRPLAGPLQLAHGDILRIGSQDPGLMVTMSYDSPSQAVAPTAAHTVTFGEKSVIQFGRDPANDVILDTPVVSRFHAKLERIGQRYRLTDLRSSNGTFVNEQQIEGEVWINQNDTIRIGPYRFVMGVDALAQYDETGGLQVEAINLNKWVRKDLNILKNISTVFNPREFIVVVGQSGGGKSTLLDAIAGYRPATHGQVFINDVDAYKNFNAVRNNIGYVPQKDIIHMELTVYQALDYAARLRMPPDTTKKERQRRIEEVLEDLDLAHRRDVQVSGLSGGQQKRVSIGVELLTKPGLFFLDEATSGLDPGTETSLMQLLRRLADQGRTIILVTHATKNVMLADKVLFLARGGYLAWFGPPDEALQYFDQFRSESERRSSEMEFDKIYAILDDPSYGSAEDWAQRYQGHPAYQQYILQPLYQKQYALEAAAAPGTSPRRPVATKSQRQTSSLRQFLILSSRNLKILTRDRTSLILMLLAAPLVGMLILLIANISGRNIFDFNRGNLENILMSFFLLVIFAVFVGGLSQMREIVKESDIYKRERLVNLKLIPYVFSKVWIAGILALYQAAVYIAIYNFAYVLPGGSTVIILLYISMALLVMSGMMLGLLASALSPNANTAPMIVIILIMPQIVLSGSLVPIPGEISAVAASRWGFEGFMIASGVGSDIAADPCWQLDDDVRDTMSIEDATAQCACLGTNILVEESCSFPGVGQFYDPIIDEPKPIEPPSLREQPAEPEIPPAPPEPEDQSDQVAMTEYFNALQAYQDEVQQIQDEYKAEMRVYEAEADVYASEMTAYQEELLDWEIGRASAVDPAVGLVDNIHDEFGWTFVDKSDAEAFWSRMITTWVAQIVIISVIILGVIFMVKRKDAV
ncbi:MAG: FHA domain-containing protein [Anaerolineales bacterium]|nr:FHA domain-containing protein [Anaerolineales bacterium]